MPDSNPPVWQSKRRHVKSQFASYTIKQVAKLSLDLWTAETIRRPEIWGAPLVMLSRPIKAEKSSRQSDAEDTEYGTVFWPYTMMSCESVCSTAVVLAKRIPLPESLVPGNPACIAFPTMEAVVLLARIYRGVPKIYYSTPEDMASDGWTLFCKPNEA